MNKSANNQRIAKNTLMLYMRTFATILISLYTSRVILSTLGETDFGVYNIIAGVIILFSFIQSAMSSATQRFLNIEMGKGDTKSINNVFSMSMTAHISIAIVILLIAETIGLWFVNTKLNIPEDRVVAAQWVYQFSILTACINIIRVPYNASIVANERMSFYAYISIIECILKLLIVYILFVVSTDKLILYSILLFSVNIIITICYKIFCNIRFSTCRYRFYWDKKIYCELMSFSGWSLMGSLSVVSASQGVNILINIFFSVVVNAAMGIANQVQAAVSSFASNFQTAFNPQLVKSYAAGEFDYFEKLICQTSKFSFFMIYIMVLPLIISADTILHIWLNNVPQYTLQFVQLILMYILIEAMASPIWTAIQAVGKIRNYQILIAIIISLNIPITYILFNLGFSPVAAIVAKVAIAVVTLFARVIYLSRVTKFSLSKYISEVLQPCFLILLISAPLCVYIASKVNNIISLFIAVIITSVVILTIGLSRNEIRTIINVISRKR